MTQLTEQEMRALQSLDTPTVANAIETFRLRLRNEGYINSAAVNHFPRAKPMLGYAVTMKMHTDGPPHKGSTYPDRSDWWDTIASLPNPKVMVLQDADKYVGIGSLAGEIHASIFKALGCTGIVTNGAVRDLAALDASGLHVYSGHISPSHAYAHIISVGAPVELYGQTIHSGDLLHGDAHGIVIIPPEIAAAIPVAAATIREHERAIIDFCASPDFSVQRLREMVVAFNNINTGDI